MKNPCPKMAGNTFINKVFQGTLERQITCNECHFEKKGDENFIDLSLNLTNNQTEVLSQSSRGVRAFRAASRADPLSSEAAELTDCLEEFFKTDQMDEDNKVQCSKCSAYTQARVKFKLKKLPKVLIIHLKRFT
mmetsp:Transcript_5917/g.9649  ORF Transcript_5917/g.9649 Transcript_5917/m.9649 type:complete len:134 (-) Transcript_5917:495-896(-)